MAGYICPECGTDLDVLHEDVRAHALSHWGPELGTMLSKEAKDRRDAMLDEHARRQK